MEFHGWAGKKPGQSPFLLPWSTALCKERHSVFPSRVKDTWNYFFPYGQSRRGLLSSEVTTFKTVTLWYLLFLLVKQSSFPLQLLLCCRPALLHSLHLQCPVRGQRLTKGISLGGSCSFWNKHFGVVHWILHREAGTVNDEDIHSHNAGFIYWWSCLWADCSISI